MPVIRWILNHLVIIFVAVLVVAGLVYQKEIERELVQLGVMDGPSTQTASVSEDSAPAQMPTQLTPAAQDNATANEPLSEADNEPAAPDASSAVAASSQSLSPAEQAAKNKAAFEQAQAKAKQMQAEVEAKNKETFEKAQAEAVKAHEAAKEAQAAAEASMKQTQQEAEERHKAEFEKAQAQAAEQAYKAQAQAAEARAENAKAQAQALEQMKAAQAQAQNPALAQAAQQAQAQAQAKAQAEAQAEAMKAREKAMAEYQAQQQAAQAKARAAYEKAQADAQAQAEARRAEMQAQHAKLPAQQVPTNDKLDPAVLEQWTAARTAFWQRDLNKAEELYKALVETTQDADVAGELGNVYFVQRRFEEAANMYFETGVRLLAGDTPWAAGSLMGMLYRLDQGKANELRTLMQAKHAEYMKKAAAANQNAPAQAPNAAPAPAAQ